MPQQISLCNGRYIFDKGKMTNDNNGNWIILKDDTTGQNVFIKEFLKFRYIFPEPGEELSDRAKENNARFDRYYARMEKIKTELKKIAGAGGSVVVLLELQKIREYIFKVTPCIDYLHWKDEEIHTKLSVEALDDLMRELLTAMQTLHNIGVLHCDLKTDNVFIVGDEENGYGVKVNDFDDSIMLDDIPDNRSVVGTPEWESPELKAYAFSEQELASPSPDLPLTPASDIYSLGLIYHVYLTGIRPKGVSGISKDLDIPRMIVIRQAIRKKWYQRTPDCTTMRRGLDMVFSMHQNRSSTLRVMDGNKPAGNRDVQLVLVSQVFSDSSMTSKTPLGEVLCTLHTDPKGTVSFPYGMPYINDPDYSYLLLVDSKQHPFKWTCSGNKYTAEIQIADQLFVVVTRNGIPVPDQLVKLYREAEDGVHAGPVLKTGPDGRAELSEDGEWFAIINYRRYPVVRSGNLYLIELPQYKDKEFRVLTVRRGKPVPNVRFALQLFQGETLLSENTHVTRENGEKLFKNLPEWNDGTRLVYRIVSNGKILPIDLDSNKLTVELPPEKVRVSFAAKLRDDSAYVGGLAFGIRPVDGGDWIALNYTKESGPLEINKKLDPGRYKLVVTGVREDYSLLGFKNNQALITIPDNVPVYTVTFYLDRKAPIIDKTFDRPREGLYTRLVIYPSGYTEVYTTKGKRIQVNRNSLGLYGMAEYKEK